MNNLQNYFTRIGYAEDPSISLATLEKLQQLHTSVIPFENIDVLLGLDVDLKPEAIEKKLIVQGRGGYCFEHNNLFMKVLHEIGFQVDPLLARVTWKQPDNGVAGPRTHMVLRVRINDDVFLADVGFGGLVIPRPLRFGTSEAQTTNHEIFRIIEHKHGYRVDVLISGRWLSAYDVADSPQEPIDFEVANWYTSGHPDSKFRRNLMMARVTRDTRYALLNNRFSIRKKGHPAVKQVLDAQALSHVVSEQFLLPHHPEWQSLFERIVEAAK